MPRPRRNRTAGLIFHALNRGAKRAVLFENAADYIAFERLLAAAVDRFGVALFSYCLMPNHWHLLLSSPADGGLGRFMHWLTTTHACRWQAWHGPDTPGAVYQGRYKAIPIGNDRHFLWVCRYIERNPLRASLVGRAQDWPWSSLRARRTAADWLAPWPVPPPCDWEEHVAFPQTESELEHFRRCMRRGEPFGNEEWRTEVCTKLGLKPSKGRGRPWRQPIRTVLNK